MTMVATHREFLISNNGYKTVIEDKMISEENSGEVKIVLYDSDCPLCTFQMKLLTWLDWFNQVSC